MSSMSTYHTCVGIFLISRVVYDCRRAHSQTPAGLNKAVLQALLELAAAKYKQVQSSEVYIRDLNEVCEANCVQLRLECLCQCS